MINRAYGTVSGGRLILRATADAAASAVVSIPDGTLLLVAEHDDTWYATSYGAHTGFVMKQYVTRLDWTSAIEAVGEVTGGSLNMRRTPAALADRLIQIPDGTATTVIDFDADSPWYIATYHGYAGYVMKAYISITQPMEGLAYGQVNVSKLNVRRKPSTSAKCWNNVWPLGRIVLIKDAADGWYASLYRGQAAYVAKKYISVLKTPVHARVVDRMLFMVPPELGRDDAAYFHGYSGDWCHRFADWLAMNAGMPAEAIPNTSNCGKGIVWFIKDQHSGGFHFKSAEHKARFIRNYGVVNHLNAALTVAEEAYKPEPGDYIYFRWKKASASVNVSYVGIVATVGEDSLTTWEGNVNSQVVNRAFALNSDQIVGYGKPAYHSSLT